MAMAHQTDKDIDMKPELYMALITWASKVSFLVVAAVCDQLVSKLDDGSCTGKRNLALPLDVVREICTGRFYIVGSEEFR